MIVHDPPRHAALEFESGRDVWFPFERSADGTLSIPRFRTVPRVDKGRLPGHFLMFPAFRPASVSEAKSPGTTRIVALGGSTVYGLWVDMDETFTSVLKGLLESRLKGPVEVVNLGVPGWGTADVLRLSDVVAALAPDVVVVYAGHNELLSRSPEAPADLLLTQIRAVLLRYSSTARWMDHLIFNSTRGRLDFEPSLRAPSAAVSIVDMSGLPGDSRRHPPQAAISRARREFSANLTHTVRAVRAVGAQVVAVTPVSNLLHPPLDAPDPQSQSARLRHRRGLALLRSGELDAAHRELSAALDADVQTHRMRSEFADTLFALAEREQFSVLDLRPTFWEATTNARKPLFLDHVHPTPWGHEIAAMRLVPHVVDALEREEQGASEQMRQSGPPGVT